MFKNYLKIAFRTLIRQKSTSFINIACLTIGISACLLLLLWVQDELSFDRFHEKANRIYRVFYRTEANNIIERCVSTPAPLAPALVNEFPWIQKAMKIDSYKETIKIQGKSFKEEIFLSDPEIFNIFTIPLVEGDRNTALKEPYTMLISESKKNKYFGKANPIGKNIELPNWNREYTIIGVFKDIPHNSHIRIDFLGSFNKQKGGSPDWGIRNYYTYILIKEDAPLETFNEKMPQFVEKYMGKHLRDMYKFTYLLQPLTQIHLISSAMENDIAATMDVSTVYIVSAIAFFILFIACLNYIHLTTAKFSNRSKEAALRKILGASKRKLISQFLVESFLHTIIAFLLAVFIANAFLPLFISLSDKPLDINAFNNWPIIIGMLGIVIMVGLFSGIVPALFMLKFNLILALKGVYKSNPLISVLRKFLVVFQFAMAIIFFICTLIISDQLIYMSSKNMGLNKENVINIAINKNEEAIKKYKVLKHEFLQNPDVVRVSVSGFTPGNTTWNMNYWIDGMLVNASPMIACIPVDYDFIDTFQLKIAAGRGFSENFPTDAENAFIINKAAEKAIGYESAVGKNFSLAGGWKKGPIIGVVDNFNYNSLHGEVKPLALYIDPPTFDFFSIRIQPGRIPKTIEYLKRKWAEFLPGETFEYSFIDEDYEHLYKTEFRTKKIFISVAILEILLSCLGIFGLITYSAEKRTKEIGIRKVLGASVRELNILLLKEFILWILAANVLAWPIAWYAMRQWLQNFAYRIEISPLHFLLAGLIVFIIAVLTIIYKTVKTASADPVEALKEE